MMNNRLLWRIKNVLVSSKIRPTLPDCIRIENERCRAPYRPRGCWSHPFISLITVAMAAELTKGQHIGNKRVWDETETAAWWFNSETWTWPGPTLQRVGCIHDPTRNTVRQQMKPRHAWTTWFTPRVVLNNGTRTKIEKQPIKTILPKLFSLFCIGPEHTTMRLLFLGESSGFAERRGFC